MRVSERLGTKLWASALVVALTWVNAPMPSAAQDAAGASENTPAATTGTVDEWLGNARQAMMAKNWSLAEYYIQIADKVNKQQPDGQLAYTPEMAKRELATLRGITAPANTEPAAAPASQQSTPADANAKQALFKARQSLAMGQVEAALKMVDHAEQLNADWKSMGDSPRTVRQLIARQGELAKMAAADDSSYNGKAAAFLLQQAHTLIVYGDHETAEVLVNHAKRFPVEFTPEIGNPDQLMALITSAKDKAAQQKSAPTAQAAVQSNLSPKAEVMKLLSMAQLAMDQGDWNKANLMVNQAKAYQVPDAEFASDEMRPWQMELKIQQALNLNQSTAEVANQMAMDQGVVQTSFTDESDSRVVTAEYNPNNDDTRNVQVAGATVIDSGTASAPIPSRGMSLYRSGLKALDNADRERAREYFEMAWRYQDQLDETTRQSVQDQLSTLTVAQVAHNTSQDFETPNQANTPQPTRRIRDGQAAAFDVVRSKVFKERAAADRMLQSSPREALEKFTSIRSMIAQSELSDDSQRPLLRILDRDIDEAQRYIETNLPEIMNVEANDASREAVANRRQNRLDVEVQIQRLTDDFNRLADEGRWAEAEAISRQARDLAPEDENVVALVEKARVLTRVRRMEGIKDRKEQGVFESLALAEAASEPMGDKLYDFGDKDSYMARATERLRQMGLGQYDSEIERTIWNRLKNELVQGQYRGTLAEAVEQLSRQAGVNIIFDTVALNAEDVSVDQTVDANIMNPIRLQSAMNIILGSAGLTFVVEDEVIKVTSKDAQRRNVKPKTYYVGDLVTPVTNFNSTSQMNFMQPAQGYQGQAYGNQLSGSPMMMPQNNGQPQMMSPVAALASNNPAVMGQNLGNAAALGRGGVFGGGYGGGGTQTGQQGGQYNMVGPNRLGGITEADFDPLIELIKSTIAPDDWDDTNGDGTIQPFVSNLSLIVSNTQEVQDEIQDLLERLRELNDVQIVVEVRFITLADNFFERVGIDFDFRINDNSGLTSNQLQDTVPQSTIVGRDPDITPGVPNLTSDLDIGFNQGSFASSVPQFGGFDVGTAANFGFAILSDIEVFFLISATKGDLRSNIMQAPTVTMFNGQSASITDGSQRPFVTSVTPVVGDFAVAHQPVITILPDGTNLNVQAVVSHDRRFVRMTLVPYFSQVTSVSTFQFAGSSTTRRSSDSLVNDLLDVIDGGTGDAGDGDDNNDVETVNEGVTVQLPILTVTSVNTVVSVPDGGTVLMGGIKRLAESRAERGVPFLSNLPYVNRLFKNVGIGRETSNLMMMVTPRIIIQEEEERNQVGQVGGN